MDRDKMREKIAEILREDSPLFVNMIKKTDKILDLFAPYMEALVTMDTICRNQIDSHNRHPLTCGNDGNHTPLYPIIGFDEIILVCRECGYKQIVNLALKQALDNIKEKEDG